MRVFQEQFQRLKRFKMTRKLLVMALAVTTAFAMLSMGANADETSASIGPSTFSIHYYYNVTATDQSPCTNNYTDATFNTAVEHLESGSSHGGSYIHCITLNSGFNGALSYNLGSDVTMSLNTGATLTINASSSTNAYTVSGSGGTLTVTAGTVYVSGSFAQINASSTANVVDTGTVNITSGDNALNVSGNTTVTLDNGGTIIGNYENGTGTSGSAVVISGSPTVSITGYTLTTGNATTAAYQYNAYNSSYNYNSGTLSPIIAVSGGTNTFTNCFIHPYANINWNDFSTFNEDSTVREYNRAIEASGGSTTVNGTSRIYSFNCDKNMSNSSMDSNTGSAILLNGSSPVLSLKGSAQLTAYCNMGVNIESGTFNLGSGEDSPSIRMKDYYQNSISGIYNRYYSTPEMGVYVDGMFNMNSGSIFIDNDAYYPADEICGVYADDGTANIHGGSVSVYVDGSGDYYNATNACGLYAYDAGVINMDDGTVNVESDELGTTAYPVQIVGVYADYGTVNLSDDAEVYVSSNYSINRVYGLVAEYGDVNMTRGNPLVDVTVNGESSASASDVTAYGAYVMDEDAQATLTSGTVQVSSTRNTSGAKLYGIWTESGNAALKGAKVYVNNSNGNAPGETIGAYINDESEDSSDEDFLFTSGLLDVQTSSSSSSATGIYLGYGQEDACVVFTGGEVHMNGESNLRGVTNETGTFIMGTHGETEAITATNHGTVGFPYIYVEAHTNSEGVRNNTNTSLIYSGEVQVEGDYSNGLYLAGGNMQVLTNQHEGALYAGTPENVTFKVTAERYGMYVADAADISYAIRGRGGLFVGESGLFIKNTDVNDGALQHGTSCDPEDEGAAACAPVSGGTFVSTSTAYKLAIDSKNGNVADLIPANHYFRDDSSVEDYTMPSDGTRVLAVENLSGIACKAVTVTDAEWEVRAALEYVNGGDYTLPCDISLDRYAGSGLYTGAEAEKLHGIGTVDGDIDAAGLHTLELNGYTLDYSGSAGSGKTNANVDEVIEVVSGKLALVNSKQTATADIVHGIVYRNAAGQAVRVDDGAELVFGTLAVEDNLETTDVDESEPAVYACAYNAGGNGILNAGTVTVNAGTIRGATASAAGVDGIVQTAGTLTVNGGWILGGEDNAAAHAVSVTGGNMTVNGGVIGDGVNEGPGGNTGILFNSNGGLLTVNDGRIYGNFTGGSIGIDAQKGTVLIKGGTVLGDYNTNAAVAENYTAVKVSDSAKVIVAVDRDHTIGRVKVVGGRFDLMDDYYAYNSDAEKPEDFAESSTIYALNVSADGSAYINGGRIEENSTVSGGELKADSGVFEADLTVTGGSTFFVAGTKTVHVDGDNAETTDVDETATGFNVDLPTAAKVQGTTTVSGAGTKFIAQDGSFAAFNGAAASDIQLHGGLYDSIANSTAQHAVSAIESSELIPANHFVTLYNVADKQTEDYTDAIGGTYRMGMSSLTAPTGKKLEVIGYALDDLYEHLDAGKTGSNYVGASENSYKLPCFIDLGSGSNCRDDAYGTFRTADVTFDCGSGAFGTVTVSQNAHTLDLNSYGITYTGASSNSDTLRLTGGSLDVTDSTDAAKGIIQAVANGNDAAYVNGGSLTLTRGSFSGDSADNRQGNGIVAHTGTLTVKSTAGTIQGWNALLVDNSAERMTTNLYGGTFTGTDDGADFEGNPTSAVTNIYGGLFTHSGDHSDANAGTWGLEYNSGKVTVTGGTFSCMNVTSGSLAGIMGTGLGLNDNTDQAGTAGLGAAKDTRLNGTASWSQDLNNTWLAKRTNVKESGSYYVTDGTDDSTGLALAGYYTVTKSIPVSLTVSNGTLTTSTPVYVGYNGSATFGVTPTSGYTVFSYRVTSGSAGAVSYDSATSTVTVGYVTGESASVTVTFSKVNNGGGGGGSSSPATLKTEDHFAYLQGYDDGTFRPDGNLTRAEAAAVFYRLLENTTSTGSVSFKDVNSSYWAYKQIKTLAEKGILTGYADGTFRPAGKITRAEFCAIASRFFDLKVGSISYSDVAPSFWAYKYIASAAGYGWIDATEDTFRPNDAITRAEATRIVNAMLDRSADKTYVDKNLKNEYPDVTADNEFYYDIMEASVAHVYTVKNGAETWTSLK